MSVTRSGPRIPSLASTIADLLALRMAQAIEHEPASIAGMPVPELIAARSGKYRNLGAGGPAHGWQGTGATSAGAAVRGGRSCGAGGCGRRRPRQPGLLRSRWQ